MSDIVTVELSGQDAEYLAQHLRGALPVTTMERIRQALAAALETRRRALFLQAIDERIQAHGLTYERILEQLDTRRAHLDKEIDKRALCAAVIALRLCRCGHPEAQHTVTGECAIERLDGGAPCGCPQFTALVPS
jgi:hypothetical protein